MRKTYLAYVVLLSFLSGILGPVGVAVAQHKWHIPVDHWLPGASALFLPPLLLTAFVFVGMSARFWRSVDLGVKAIALLLCGPAAITGIFAAIPVICSVAGECL
jgi:hypothetical protein